TIFLINFFGSGLFSFILYLLFFRQLNRQDGPEWLKIILSAGVVAGTWIISYGVSVNNHTPAALLLFMIYCRLKNHQARSGVRHYIATGLLCSLLTALDIPAGGIISLAVLILTAGGKDWRFATPCVISGMAFPLGISAALSYLAYGNALPVYLVPGAYDFKNNIHSAGIAGLRSSGDYLSYLFHITFGQRGIFSHMPALILIFPLLIKARSGVWKQPVNQAIAPAVLGIVIFYSVCTGDYGGWAYGFRFLIPIIPVLWLVISEHVVASRNKALHITTLILLIIGIFTSAVGAYNPWPVAYENASSGPREVEQKFRCPLLGNLLCIGFEHFTNSPVTRYIATEVYEQNDAAAYLSKSFWNLKYELKKQPDGIRYVKPFADFFLFYFIEKYLWAAFKTAAAAGLLIFISAKLITLFYSRQAVRLYAGDAFLQFMVIATALCSLIAAFCGYAHMLTGNAILLTEIVLAIAVSKIKKNVVVWRVPEKDRISLGIAAAGLIIIIIGIAIFLPLVPFKWDSLTYHVYMPVRWVQEQMIFHISTVFGDNAAAFAPKNTSLLYSVLLCLAGTTVFLRLIQVAFLFFTCVCIYKILLMLNAHKRIALAGGIVFICIPVAYFESMSATNDIMMTGLLCGGVLWLIKFMDKTNFRNLFFCSLSIGLAAGAKSVGLVFAIPLLMLLAAVAVYRKKWWYPLYALLFFIAGGGWWYLYNMMLYGNPLFPVQIGFGNIIFFKGVYTSAAVRAGEFYISNFAELIQYVRGMIGMSAFLLLLAAPVGFVAESWRNKKNLPMLMPLFAIYGVWLLIYLCIIPHNNQVRFLLPAIALAIPGIAVLFRHRFYVVILLMCACLNMYLLLPGLEYYSKGVPFLLTAFLWILLAASAILTYLIIVRKKSAVNLLPFAAVLVFTIFIAAESVSPRLAARALLKDDYSFWSGTYLRFNEYKPELPPVTIAYSGFNIPGALVGDRMRNRVVYCNVQGRQEDGFYDFWRASPGIYSYHKPGFYRNNPDYGAWLKNIFEAGADILAVFPMHPAELKYLKATPDGYPVEDSWAKQHPEIFTLVIESSTGRIYLINRPEENK
ncbi:MAG: hypothetical protein ACYC4Q_03375, partial [Victivallaceae bacterium]